MSKPLTDAQLLACLDEAGADGLDLSPGDPIASQAAARLRWHRAELAKARAEIEAQDEALRDDCRLARAIDVAMHGEEGAAKQASLCDLVEPARMMRAENERLRAAAQALIDDVRRRHPREELSCPYMLALVAALAPEGKEEP